ncbi:major capsid protein [Ochrobactrum sp. GPK 3]
MALELWTQRELIGIRRDMRLERPTDFWRKTFFGGAAHFSKNKEIHFGEITGNRAMAPFALPSHLGKPIFKDRGVKLESFLPGYIKLLDAVRPEDATTVTPEELLTGNQLDMNARFDLRTAEISRQHLEAIYRTWDWMCARAIIDGKVVIKYDVDQGQAHPEVTIDFGRDAAHTVVYTAGNDWSDPNLDIFDHVQSWIDVGRKAKFGGSFNRMIVGANVAPYFQANKSILDKLSTQIRGGEGTTFTRGLQYYSEDNNTPTYLGTLGGNGGAMEVYTYSDQQIDDAGNLIEVLDPNDVLLTAGGVEGLMAFGAIYDLQAIGAGSGGGARTDIFQKQYVNDNPSQLNMLSQSAPLPIPRYPNRTLKATVLA